jgi:gliding motility-associated-like protein
MKLIAYIVFFVPTVIFSQLLTNTSMSPPQLVQNVLLGEGVNVSNINFTGSLQAIGSFTANNTNLGLGSGIVITTGTVLGNSGPQGPNDDGASGIDNGEAGAQILNGILGQNNTFNGAVLEFDFQAVGDLVSFNYVFGSEEYLEYVSAGFNDVFGLFISGPGIVGTQNIAKLPNQTIVSIDNVNNVSNGGFYVDNGDGGEAPFNGSNLFIQYDGFTRVLTASSPVQCGGTYHLTIAIADVGDPDWDSGIFLEAESLVSEAATEIILSTSGNYFGDPTIIAEGCTSADFTFTRTNTTNAINIPIEVSGTAQSGLDYTNSIPAVLSLNAGQASATFTFDAILDAVVDDLETIVLNFLVPDECVGVNEQEFTITLKEVEPISVILENDTIFCDGAQTVTLTPILTGGIEPITYEWSTNATTPTITVAPQQTTNYTVTVTDFCLNSTATDNADVYIPPIVPVVIEPILDLNELCPFVERQIVPEVSGGAGSQYNFSWTINGQNAGTASSITIEPEFSVNVTLSVNDGCGSVANESFIYTVQTPVLIPEINQPTIVCPGDSVLLSANATLGLGAYSYIWSHSMETTQDVWVNPLLTSTYTVNISDECQTYSIPISTSAPVHQPYADFSVTAAELNMGEPIKFNNQSLNGVSFVWNLGNGIFTAEENPITTYPDIGTYLVTLISTDDFGCIDTISREINIGYVLYIPNSFTPDGNRFNNTFFAKSINIDIIKFEIYNRWGELVFEATNDSDFKWDGNYNGKECPDGVYTYSIRYKTKSSREETKQSGHVTLLR